VVRADRGADLFKAITVRPAVDFKSIEGIIVLHTRKILHDVVRYAP